MLSSKQILIFFDTSKADDINEEKGKFQFATKISFHGQLMKKFKLHRSNGWILCHVSWAKFTFFFLLWWEAISCAKTYSYFKRAIKATF